MESAGDLDTRPGSEDARVQVSASAQISAPDPLSGLQPAQIYHYCHSRLQSDHAIKQTASQSPRSLRLQYCLAGVIDKQGNTDSKGSFSSVLPLRMRMPGPQTPSGGVRAYYYLNQLLHWNFKGFNFRQFSWPVSPPPPPPPPPLPAFLFLRSTGHLPTITVSQYKHLWSRACHRLPRVYMILNPGKPAIDCR